MNKAKRSIKTNKKALSRPKHHQNNKYLQVYWPYLPLISILFFILVILSPWNLVKNKDVLAYATNVSTGGLLNETNKQRLANKKSALTINTSLNQAAQAKADDMAKRNYWSHNTPENNEPWVFITMSGYEYHKAGENLAYGFADDSQIVKGWMNSPSHRDNLLDELFSEVGFGYTNAPNFTDKGPVTITVAMYASPASKTVPTTANSKTQQESITNTNSSTLNNTSKPIGIAQILTGGSTPWIPYIIGFVIGISITILFIKHAVGMKRAVIDGEKFLIHHPLLDATLLSLVILGLLLSNQVGTIL
jgi:hypothetical protein